jgi:hypothetical protein
VAGDVLRIAVLATVYRYLSHAQHMVDRLLVGYPYGGQWRRPAVKVVSLYVDQHPAEDQSRDRAREFGFRTYSTVAETLRCGGSQLSVDAVLIIAEHGEYELNHLRQKLYPRYTFFKQCVEVFEEDGVAVPVFNDKHLSYSYSHAFEMVQDSQRLGFPLMAGSLLPYTWRLPDLEIPNGTRLDEAIVISEWGGAEMGFHLLEALQCMVERRSMQYAGRSELPEQGVEAIEVVAGPKVWNLGRQGVWSEKLLEAALSRADSILGRTLDDGRTQDLLGSGELERLCAASVRPGRSQSPVARMVRYRDGFRATVLSLRGALRDTVCFATQPARGEPMSTQFLVTEAPNVTCSACQVHKIVEMIETGVAPVPVERTLLTSGMMESCMRSQIEGGRVDTPHLEVGYHAPTSPQHAVD